MQLGAVGDQLIHSFDLALVRERRLLLAITIDSIILIIHHPFIHLSLWREVLEPPNVSGPNLRSKQARSRVWDSRYM